MKFFPGYMNNSRRQTLDAAALRWNQIGQSQKKDMRWGDRSQVQGGVLMLESPTPLATAHKGKQASKHIPGVTGPDSSLDLPVASSTAWVNGVIISKSGGA